MKGFRIFFNLFIKDTSLWQVIFKIQNDAIFQIFWKLSITLNIKEKSQREKGARGLQWGGVVFLNLKKKKKRWIYDSIYQSQKFDSSYSQFTMYSLSSSIFSLNAELRLSIFAINVEVFPIKKPNTEAPHNWSWE